MINQHDQARDNFDVNSAYLIHGKHYIEPTGRRGKLSAKKKRGATMIGSAFRSHNPTVIVEQV